jgi:transcriptional regulator with XRE-family HTH domain
MTREELAGTPVSLSYLTNLENRNKTNPTLKTLNVLAIRLGVPLVQFDGEPVDRSPADVEPRGGS